MTYAEALDLLGQTRRFGMKLGLDSMRELARALGSPQDGLRFIHLAGTNGKGSTAAFCESCLRASGFRVGLYTSPHLVSVRERIQINRAMISEADFGEGMGVVQRAAATCAGQEPTFFEWMTALALWYFAREKVDWVVWETGLGGRLDATNIVTPQVCIITNIGLEHQQYLGATLAEIAAEKAGIIKPGVPVVSAVENGEAAEVIHERIKRKRCLSTWVGASQKDLGLREGRQWAELKMGYEMLEFPLGLIGAHQVRNAACAVAAMDHIRWGHAPEFNPAYHPQITADTIAKGLESTSWPGRFEILSERPLIVLDGAHNPAAMTMLVETWRAFLAAKFGWKPEEIDGRARIVFASVADKDISEMAQMLRPLAREIALVRLANERGADPHQLVAAFPGLPVTCYDSVADAWQTMQEADPSSLTLITGSAFSCRGNACPPTGNGGRIPAQRTIREVSVSPLTRQTNLMARIRAIIFDAGGTLLYPADPVGDTYAKFARKFGVKLGPEATETAFREAFRSLSPRPKGDVPSDGNDRAWWKQVVTKSMLDQSFADPAAFEAFFEEVYLHFAKADAWGIYPEALEVLETLRDREIDCAVLSNWDARLHTVLDGCGLGEYLPHRFISAELGWEKPDPAIYRHVVEILRIPAGSLLSVGDDPKNDVEGPKRAGWQAVQIERPKRDLWSAIRAVTKR